MFLILREISVSKYDINFLEIIHKYTGTLEGK